MGEVHAGAGHVLAVTLALDDLESIGKIPHLPPEPLTTESQ